MSLSIIPDENLYLINIVNIYSPKENFEIHNLKKDSIYGLTQFIKAINKNFGEAFNIELLEEYDIPFSKDDFTDIDISFISIESITIDLVDDFSIFNKVLNLYKNTQYNKVYIHTLVDNSSFLYIFIDTEKLSLYVNIDDFIEGIRVGSSFEGGFLKNYTFNSELNIYM
jgi:hypothetical protein